MKTNAKKPTELSVHEISFSTTGEGPYTIIRAKIPNSGYYKHGVTTKVEGASAIRRLIEFCTNTLLGHNIESMEHLQTQAPWPLDEKERARIADLQTEAAKIPGVPCVVQVRIWAIALIHFPDGRRVLSASMAPRGRPASTEAEWMWLGQIISCFPGTKEDKDVAGRLAKIDPNSTFYWRWTAS